ncbi:DNA-directed RNA polymerase III subunit RPC4 [Sesbania bispinosa]|nr:DNA-directed RNA polymerase III subunit RPC4 [Sesbania bispinosa]
MDLDPNQNSSTRRKVKFAPTKKPKPVQAKATKTEEAVDGNDEDSAQAQALLRRWNENLARREPKAERKSSVQVAFGPGGSSLPLRTFGIGKGVDSSKNSGSASKYFANEQNGLTRSSTAIEDQNDTNMIDETDDTTKASARKIKGKYKEPWDYDHSYYPTTLPLRKPYSGNPEILDEKEFGEAAASVEYDENTVNPAAELELLEKSEQQSMLFFQLPALPFVKQSVSRKGKEKIGTSTVSGEPNKGSALEELPKGYAGKMLVYKSGAIKLKLGETLFDVSPGSKCIFDQDVVAMNTAHKQCCVLGEISKSVIVTPDLDSIEL